MYDIPEHLSKFAKVFTSGANSASQKFKDSKIYKSGKSFISNILTKAKSLKDR